MRNADLLQFQKPGRYLGKEWNLDFKSPASGDLKVCVCFPEIYEVGMSNLGFRIVHSLLSSEFRVSCERCFMPGDDLENYLFKTGTYLFSLETKTALKDFDIVGFSLNYELNFFNFLKMLKMGGIKLKKRERQTPLILVGGLNNPEPIEEFVDIFFLGEFEEKAFSFIEKLRKSKNLSRRDKLQSLLDAEGVYIPEFYRQESSRIEPKQNNAPFPLKRTYVSDLNKYFYPQNWLVSYIPLVFDRLQIELQRGCPNRCKFCQARGIYYPYRERNPSLAAKRVKNLYKSTGYEAISLLGLSVIDYSGLEAILEEIIPYFEEKRVGIFIPSLRPTARAHKILEMLSFAKKPGLTIAMETASRKLRESIGKDIDIQDVRELIRSASRLGYRHFKFYFMIGLPGETEQDVIAIGDTLEELAGIYKKEKGSFPQINVSVNYFIPKPFSEFEVLSMESYPKLKKKKSLIKERVARNRFIKINFSDFDNAFLEYLLPRADRSISVLIEEIFDRELKKPGSFRNIEIWTNLSKKFNLDLDLFLKSDRGLPKHIVI